MILIGCKCQSPTLYSTGGLRRNGTALTEESLKWLVVCDKSERMTIQIRVKLLHPKYTCKPLLLDLGVLLFGI